MTVSQFIKGAPMRPPSHFIGPLAWWSDSLTCGGVERQVVASARFFQQQGKKVTLLCRTISPGGGNDFFLQEAQSCSRVLGFSLDVVDRDLFYEARAIVSEFVSGASQVFVDSISAYAAWLLRVRPRLLHLWNADHLEPLLAAFIAGVPKIIIAGQSLSPAQRAPHGFESVDDHAAFAILANLMRFPHVVMTNNSRAGCRTYEDWLGLPPGTVRLTPNVFDLQAWPRPESAQIEHLRQSLGIPQNARVLGGLFRFVSIKDPELWVSTAIRACAAVPDLYAVVGGHGPELESLRARMAQTPFAGRILFPGPVRDVPAFLSLCSVFLLTSHVEGLPNVLLEAQAYKVPVVTTRCGGAADVVEHGKSGFVLDERDAVVMAKHVEFLLGHDGFARSAGEIGRQRVAENFSPERTMGMLWDVYADILPAEFAARAPQPGEARCSTLEAGDRQCPLVSIVLPTYNHLSFLPLAIESVLGQDYPNFELVVVDDGSTDGTANYLETLESPRIRVESGPNTRLPAALNRGFALARGEYLTWVSADNVCLPHFCSSLAGALRAFPQAGFASSAFARVSPQGWALDRLAGEASLPSMLCCNSGMAAFMYRRDLAAQAGQYDPRLEGAEDWDMWLRMLSVARPVYVPQVLYHYRWHDNSMRVRLSAKVLEASTRVAFKALLRMEQSGGIGGLFPQIGQCSDQELALFHANLALGSRMIRSDSFLKAAAAKYLEAAFKMRPDDLAAMGNYAVALFWQGRRDMAKELFCRGGARAAQLFETLRVGCAKQQRHIGMYEFSCPTVPYPGPEQSELMRRVDGDRLVFSPCQAN
ncbi:glycosyltransferase [Desulfovibrio desulfuricans]|uniref:Glycosyltransferase n=1 Tax=Desulfovibrio desulfuricans TaxID=876 RepID=A0A4P7UP54_DESDE|nr:glycosyltransferase [Desulfovibrio desulfuricans]QCC86611.1 glycosyltransferase [Desulfovibrio desulfuricans]